MTAGSRPFRMCITLGHGMSFTLGHGSALPLTARSSEANCSMSSRGLSVPPSDFSAARASASGCGEAPMWLAGWPRDSSALAAGQSGRSFASALAAVAYELND
eukprot:scaffold95244_cov26-Tisochrysis_lutea.AAC.2